MRLQHLYLTSHNITMPTCCLPNLLDNQQRPVTAPTETSTNPNLTIPPIPVVCTRPHSLEQLSRTFRTGTTMEPE
jgi:hypothetical protein